jgi:DNA-3-methyladenine glycosylase II
MNNGKRAGKPAARRPTSPHAAAERHLRRAHPILAGLIKRVGPCTLTADPDYFGSLVRSIIAQQISTKAAKSVTARLEATLAPEGLTPARLHALDEATLQGCGLSGGKRRFLRALAEQVVTGALPLAEIAGLTDAEIAARLRPVPGIGPWTVDMFLMFSVGRPDVLPVGDLGLRLGVQDQFGLEQLPTPAELIALAESWRPYRSIATWYFWRSRGFVPQSGLPD